MEPSAAPSVKNRTFFFFSYEGMRYRHPVNLSNTYVPSNTLRNDPKIDPNIRALLNAFPTSTQPEVNNTQLYPYYQSSPLNSDSLSLRVDQVINSKWTLFGRYAYAPSNQQSLDAGATADLRDQSEDGHSGPDRSADAEPDQSAQL